VPLCLTSHTTFQPNPSRRSSPSTLEECCPSACAFAPVDPTFSTVFFETRCRLRKRIVAQQHSSVDALHTYATFRAPRAPGYAFAPGSPVRRGHFKFKPLFDHSGPTRKLSRTKWRRKHPPGRTRRARRVEGDQALKDVAVEQAQVRGRSRAKGVGFEAISVMHCACTDLRCSRTNRTCAGEGEEALQARHGRTT
jgi:hypothetical protein